VTCCGWTWARGPFKKAMSFERLFRMSFYFLANMPGLSRPRSQPLPFLPQLTFPSALNKQHLQPQPSAAPVYPAAVGNTGAYSANPLSQNDRIRRVTDEDAEGKTPNGEGFIDAMNSVYQDAMDTVPQIKYEYNRIQPMMPSAATRQMYPPRQSNKRRKKVIDYPADSIPLDGSAKIPKWKHSSRTVSSIFLSVVPALPTFFHFSL